MTWAQFNEIFYNKYFSQCFRDLKVSEFQELKQGKVSVVEYDAKFIELARFAPHMVDTDYKKAQEFDGGLDMEVFDRVGILKLPTYVEVLDRALMKEAIPASKKQATTPTTEWRDDIYDVYGTPEELQLFTDAIERWEEATISDLPEYMQVCFEALSNVMKEMEDKITAHEGRSCHIYYAKEAMKGLVRACFVEANWFSTKYMPTIEECLSISVMSSGYPTLVVQSLIGIGKIATKEAFDWVLNFAKL
ncbi:probable terpene synthase 2 [Camellia sinensis]|uniref:probable terpene synthase 2 n=1 Tax=Camellia sinensis TaxID=4442 RepID=UPI001035BDB0|nr:probable terpene synthase 2 [Camellia sinensis]